MERRTQEFEKQETERRIIEALVRSDPLNPQKRRLKFTELLRETNLGRATLNRALKRMELDEKISRRVEAPVGDAVEIYYEWGPEAEKIYPLVPTRRHYEKLANEFNVRVTPKAYVGGLAQALGQSLIPVLVESVRRKTPILTENLFRDFRFLVAKYVAYRKNPDMSDLRDVMKAFVDVENHPEKYDVELQELEEAAKLSKGGLRS